MQLLTEEIKKMIPALYATEDQKLEDKTVYAKLFTPDSNWSWWVMERRRSSDVLLRARS